MLHFSLKFSLGHNRNDSKAIATAHFIKSVDELLNNKLDERSASTRKNYLTAINSFKKFTNECNCSDMNENNMLCYQEWLNAQKKHRNTTSCYMRSLRSLFNMLYPDTKHPFTKVFTGCAKTEKRALPIDFMTRLVNFPPISSSPLRLWYDIFLFSVLGMGIPFVDLAHLSAENIQGDVIKYRRHKTAQLITVPIVYEMKEIIKKYDGSSPCGRLFPLLENEIPTFSEYQNLLARYNRGLRKLSLKYHTPYKLTSYVARHTWASLANASGINLKHISQALGHSSIKTTEIYLACLSTTALQRDSLIVAKMLYKGTI